MLSDSQILCMMITITACFFTPMLLLMWLMVKRRARRIPYMLFFGVLLRIACLIIQFPLISLISKAFTDNDIKMKILGVFLNQLVYSLTLVLMSWALLELLRKNGLNFNRVWTISLGYSALEIMAGTGLSYIGKVILASSIKDGSIYDSYTKDEAQKLISEINELGTQVCIQDAISAIATVFMVAASMLIILYAMAKGKKNKLIILNLLAVSIKYIIDAMLSLTAIGALSGMVFNVMVIAAAIYLSFRMLKIEKEIMIKPVQTTVL